MESIEHEGMNLKGWCTGRSAGHEGDRCYDRRPPHGTASWGSLSNHGKRVRPEANGSLRKKQIRVASGRIRVRQSEERVEQSFACGVEVRMTRR